MTVIASPLAMRPDLIDYRDSSNPCEAQCKSSWRKKIESTTMLSAHTCITHQVEHMVSETGRAMKGTKCENNFLFHHDAPSLMTAKKTREWMKEKDVEKYWILPQEGLCEDDPALKNYLGQPSGNSPELCSLDSNLDKDVHKAVERNV